MKEVSCRVFQVFFLRLEERNIAPERLVEGTNVSLATLRNKHERVDWSDLVAVLRASRKLFGPEEYVEIGKLFTRSPMVRFITLIGRLLFTARDIYGWMVKVMGAGNQMFACVSSSHRYVSDRELEVELTLADGYEMCREFFEVSLGMFMEVPRFVGLPPARVELVDMPRGARYRIHLAEGEPPVLAKLRRAVLWPFTARAAARELEEAHLTLQQRYEEIEAARSKVDRQASQLRTAHAVSSLIHGDLDLDRTLETIARALVVEAGFAGARVEVQAEVDGVAIAKTVEHDTVDDFALVRTIRGAHNRKIGALWAGVARDADVAQRRRVLDSIMPTIAMAIDNAISYRVLEDYRNSLEKRVAERTNELTAARDKLAETVEHLEEAKAIRDRIFANVNHEIRTPLSLILLAVAEARASASPARELDTIEGAARRLLRMVDELLLLAQGREGEILLRPERVDLAVVADRTVEAWRPAARQAGFTLEASLETCWVFVDPIAVERILANLLSNALKYTPTGGTIRVVVATDDGRARLDVVDDGPGIDDELRGRLFGRFERGLRAIADGVGGSGLGLSLVKELVEGQGGAIQVDSGPGKGTTVRIVWPLVGASKSPPAEVTTNLAPQDFGVGVAVPDAKAIYEPPPTSHPVATVLLAEDDPSLRDEIARLLAREHRVVVARDGEEALRLAEQHHPDLLVTDVAMPGIDGVELTRRFVSRAESRVAPVLVLTAYGEIRDRLAGFEAGAVDYIVKPFDPAELLARVRSQLAIRALALRLLDSERLASLGRLSAGLAHEIRNPANGIVNAVEPLREVLPPESLVPDSPAAQLLDVIEHCSEQIGVLSRHLLGFRRGAELERREVSLQSMLRRAKIAAGRSLDGVEVREKLDYTGSISCAEPLLQQVIANLLDNAIYAAGRGGWIELRTTQDAGKVILEVKDSGPGVAPEHKERLFEPFFTTKPPGAGTGLGLATSREIVLRHGGSLEVRGSGRDTVFRLEIPLEAS